MPLTALVRLLDSRRAAERPDPALPVWFAQFRSWDLASRIRGLPPRDADALLIEALAELARSGATCYLVADAECDLHDLGPGAWRRLTEHSWVVPPEMEPHWLVERSYLGTIGDYLVYARPQPLPDAEIAPPWRETWRRPGAYRDAMQRLDIAALIAVGPDGTEWVAAVAPERAPSAP